MKVFEMFARRGLGLLSLSLRCRFVGACMDLIGCCIDFIYFLNVIPRIIFVDHTRGMGLNAYTWM